MTRKVIKLLGVGLEILKNTSSSSGCSSVIMLICPIGFSPVIIKVYRNATIVSIWQILLLRSMFTKLKKKKTSYQANQPKLTELVSHVFFLATS